MTTSSPFLERPLVDGTAWTRHFLGAEIPIFAATAAALEIFRADEDRVDANRLGELIATDPLLTLKVMAHAARFRNPRIVTAIETVTGVLVMLGIPPFFRAFGPQPTIEAKLADHPVALAELQAGLRCARDAAKFAVGFAAYRLDPGTPVIHAAALLHDFAELLLWCHAPPLGLEMVGALRLDPALTPSAAQQRVLNTTLAELQRTLADAWLLPRLLSRLNDEQQAGRPDVRCVTLATALARHTPFGWNHPAVVEDVAAIAKWLDVSPVAALELVQSL